MNEKDKINIWVDPIEDAEGFLSIEKDRRVGDKFYVWTADRRGGVGGGSLSTITMVIVAASLIVVNGFLSELGKDLYHGVKNKLLQKAKRLEDVGAGVNLQFEIADEHNGYRVTYILPLASVGELSKAIRSIKFHFFFIYLLLAIDRVLKRSRYVSYRYAPRDIRKWKRADIHVYYNQA